MSDTVQTLSPITWFQFFSKEEDAILKAWESGVRNDVSSSEAPSFTARTSRELPETLMWVARTYDPISSAPATSTGPIRTDIHAASHSSVPCNRDGPDHESHESQSASSDTDEGAGVGLFDGDVDAEEPDAWSTRSTQGRNKCALPS